MVPGAAGAAVEAAGFAEEADASTGLGELLHEASPSAAVTAKAMSLNFLVEITEKDAPDRIMR